MNAREIIDAIDPKRVFKQLHPEPTLVGWDELRELTNCAEFREPGVGMMDMWSLMGYEGLEMEDAEQQTPKFFQFIMAHKKETLRYHAAQGERIELFNDNVLKQQWLQSR